jgi:hypothetical protein
MYLSKTGLLALFGGGILLLVTLGLFVAGEESAIPQIWIAAAFVLGVAVVVWILSNAVRRVDQATLENAPREYMTTRRKFFQGYWALKAASVIFKIGSIIGLIVSLIGWLLLIAVPVFRGVPLSNFSGGGSISQSVSTIEISFIPAIIITAILTYAAGQLIDVILSVELSLRTLAARRRQRDPSPTSSE